MENKKETVVEVKRLNKTFIVNDVETKEPVSIAEIRIPDWMLRKAVKYNRYLIENYYSNGKKMWRQVDIDDYNKAKELGKTIPTKRANRKNLFEN